MTTSKSEVADGKVTVPTGQGAGRRLGGDGLNISLGPGFKEVRLRLLCL